jgi:hypothetical protein
MRREHLAYANLVGARHALPSANHHNPTTANNQLTVPATRARNEKVTALKP